MLHITALGVYEAHSNGNESETLCLPPGGRAIIPACSISLMTSQPILQNRIRSLSQSARAGTGPDAGWCDSFYQDGLRSWPAGLLAELEITYEDGTAETIGTDTSWSVAESATRFSEIYDGEQYDASRFFRCPL